jgi:hypothetical protein
MDRDLVIHRRFDSPDVEGAELTELSEKVGQIRQLSEGLNEDVKEDARALDKTRDKAGHLKDGLGSLSRRTDTIFKHECLRMAKCLITLTFLLMVAIHVLRRVFARTATSTSQAPDM